MSLASILRRVRRGISPGHERSHSPHSMHLSIRWYDLIMWNARPGGMFSSETKVLSSRTQSSQKQTGQLCVHAKHLLHFLNCLTQNFSLSSGDSLASLSDRSSFGAGSFGSPVLTMLGTGALHLHFAICSFLHASPIFIIRFSSM